MKPALSFQELRADIEQKMDQWLPRMFGYHMLKLGNLSGELNTSVSTIKHQVCVAEEGSYTGVIADIDDL